MSVIQAENDTLPTELFFDVTHEPINFDFNSERKKFGWTGDFYIKSLDGEYLLAHSEIIFKISNYFDSRKELNIFGTTKFNTIQICYNASTIRLVIDILYNIYYEPFRPILLQNKYDIDELRMLYCLDICEENLNINFFEDKIISQVIKNHSDSWLDFIYYCYDTMPNKKMIFAFLKSYTKYDSPLREINLHEIKSIKNQDLREHLWEHIFLKNQSEKYELTKKIKYIGSKETKRKNDAPTGEQKHPGKRLKI